ncbi:fatty acyl-AMP ligase [Streptomyces sp. NBC_01716]|uniref:fatty acyl-AMP ligase n=1 Tax=Streptomyces sp. NBC_01716 TaxID=2975917 RepID=UPI002E357ECF|nr:fatty acyl-AMP ligase [Streptomyces sp. NBC_01716]
MSTGGGGGGSLVDALAAVAARGSGHGMRLFRGDEEAERLTFAGLHAEAGEVACGLLERGVLRGERVAIALPTSIDFARAFFGVLAAGAVPVPVPPPVRFASLDIHLKRIALVMRQSKVRVVLTDKMLGGLLEPTLGGAGGEFRILDVATTRAPSPVYVDVAAGDPALVQYTSGTSASPKGVVLTHANLLANVDAIAGGLGIDDTDVSCNWLPLFHDMGLIGAFLSPALTDAETYLLPPEDFLRDPGRWLRIISRYGVTATTAPNSGYLYALRRTPAERVPELDLSRWRFALNGAELIDPDTLRGFSAHFAPAGFRADAFLPVYGLAEGSLAVTFAPTGRAVRSTWVRREPLSRGVVEMAPAGGDGAEAGREIVSVGLPVANTEVRLVGEDGTALTDPSLVGEIQIRGDSVMRGYEDNEPATRATVLAGGWVSTGDLGFRQDGELFIAGRKKEVIIVFGQNYYASDIESVAGRVTGVSNGAVLAAGTAFPDGEGLVLVAETKESEGAAREDLIARLRFAVSDSLGLTPRDIVLVRRGRLPRTSSGKLQRHGVEEVLAAVAPDSAPASDPV